MVIPFAWYALDPLPAMIRFDLILRDPPEIQPWSPDPLMLLLYRLHAEACEIAVMQFDKLDKDLLFAGPVGDLMDAIYQADMLQRIIWQAEAIKGMVEK